MKTRNPVRILTLACGIACSASAMAQMPNHAATRIDWLQGRGLTGLGIWIGQMEQGIADQHTAYGNRIANQDAGGTVTAHATRVAGVMLAGAQVYNGNNYTGIATGSRLVSSYNLAAPAHYTTGMGWLVNRPIEIINVSWGGTASGTEVDSETVIADWAAHSRGKLVSVAAGNDGNGTPPGSPANGFNVLTVGATGVRRGDGSIDYRRLATYSNSGTTGGHPSMSGRAKIDLVAPGTGIVTTRNDEDNNGNGNMLDDWGVAPDGTSYAAPHVSGTAALLMQHSIGKPWETSGKDPRVMRAVLINSADKNVYDRNNRRWDNPAASKGANGLDIDTGGGQLDARRSFETYRDGRVAAGANAPNVGWGTDSVAGGGAVAGWETANAVRKGSYITSTLAWNRTTSGDDAAGAAYAAGLRDLDLHIRRSSNDSIIASSASVFNSVEHVVAKMPERDRVKVEAKNHGTAPETFGIAWHTCAAPVELRSFNGDFMGDRGALNDNGWFDVSVHGSSATGKPAFADQGLDESFAMMLTPDSMGLAAGMAQELVRPTSGFWLRFDLAFTGALSDASLSIRLGDVDILGAAGYAGGIIAPQPTNVDRYQTYTIDLSGGQNLFNNLAGGYHNLSFLALGYGGGRIFVDNVTYVPATGPLALLGVGLLAIARRRR